jgi:hypothetical protein
MKDKSNVQQKWFSFGKIEHVGPGFQITDLLVRWNEQIGTRETDDGREPEYTYDAHRFDYELPPEVQPGVEAVEYYLEAAQSAVLQLAQDLAAQEAGFVDPN